MYSGAKVMSLIRYTRALLPCHIKIVYLIYDVIIIYVGGYLAFFVRRSSYVRIETELLLLDLTFTIFHQGPSIFIRACT